MTHYLPPRNCLVLYDMAPDDETSDGIVMDTRYRDGRWFFAIDPAGDIDMERVVDWCERPEFGWRPTYTVLIPPPTEESVPPTLRNVGDEL